MTRSETTAILAAIRLMADFADTLPDEYEEFDTLWRAVLALLTILPPADLEEADARWFD